MNRIKQLRKEKGLKQSELAKALNISQASVSFWETESTTPNEIEKLKLSKFFNCTPDYLMGYTDINLKEPASDTKNTIVIMGRGTGRQEFEVSDDEMKLLSNLIGALKKNPQKDDKF